MGTSYKIVSGLEAGEEVVTYGSFTIDAAAQLNNQVSMMNRNVSVKKEKIGIPNFQADTPNEFKLQLNALSTEYFLLKDAFVNTNAEAAAKAAENVVAQIKKMDMDLLKGDAHLYWMEQLNALEAHTQKIIEMKDVEEQRRQFGFLSEALINAIEAFGIKGEPVYVQYCPMAFDNQGADWIASEEQIRNPYFGDKMLRCGLVQETLDENYEIQEGE